MKVILLFLLLVYNFTKAQILEPANWSFVVEENEISTDGEISIKLKVKLAETWQLYSTDQDPAVGPLPTQIAFIPHPSYEIIGNVMAKGVKEKFDQVWQDKVRYLEDQGAFIQRIRILSEKPIIRGKIKYQLCTTINGNCIYSEKDFVFSNIVVKLDKNHRKNNK